MGNRTSYAKANPAKRAKSNRQSKKKQAARAAGTATAGSGDDLDLDDMEVASTGSGRSSSGSDPHEANVSASYRRKISIQTSNPFETLPEVGDSKETKDHSLKRATPHDDEDDEDDQDYEDDKDGPDGHASKKLKTADAGSESKGWEKVTHQRDKKDKKAKKIKKHKYPSIKFMAGARLDTKVKIADLRDLVLYIHADGSAPKWVAIDHKNQFRKIVAIMVPGLEEAMFNAKVNFATFDGETDDGSADKFVTTPDDYYPRILKAEHVPHVLRPLAGMFGHLWPIKAPGDDRLARMYSPMGSFLTAPLPKKAKHERDRPNDIKPARAPPGFKDVRTSITAFLATREELADNKFVVHPAWLSADERRQNRLEAGWVATQVESIIDAVVPEEEMQKGKDSVTAGRTVLGLDCEMVMTGPQEYSLARVSVVDWSGEVVLDELVKPAKPVVDYVTRFSGITPELLGPVTTTLQDVQRILLELLTPRSILVGHSLESDLKALQITHPFIVDTSLIFPHARGPPVKNGLKFLTEKYLGRKIQQGGASGHNSIEDAKACLDLTRQKCEKGKAWGEFEGAGENLFRKLARGSAPEVAAAPAYGSGVGVGVGSHKTSAVVDWGEPGKGLGRGATFSLGCRTDEDVARATIRAVHGDSDGSEIRAGGVDFVFARMRELEALRGWWNRNRFTDGSGGGDGPPDMHGHYVNEDSARGNSALERCLSRLVDRLVSIHDALPPCTAFIIFSGSGDPRDMSRLGAMRTQYRQEMSTPGKRFEDVSVKWTDAEDQALRKAVIKARQGIGLLSVK